MGVMDKLFGGGAAESNFTEQEAVIAILVATVAADGEISDEEVESVLAISNRMKLIRSATADQFNAMVKKAFNQLKKQGAPSVLEKAAQAISADLKPTVFALAADLVFADGSVDDEERAVVDKLQGGLKIPDELALKIVEVLQIKNRG